MQFSFQSKSFRFKIWFKVQTFWDHNINKVSSNSIFVAYKNTAIFQINVRHSVPNHFHLKSSLKSLSTRDNNWHSCKWKYTVDLLWLVGKKSSLTTRHSTFNPTIQSLTAPVNRAKHNKIWLETALDVNEYMKRLRKINLYYSSHSCCKWKLLYFIFFPATKLLVRRSDENWFDPIPCTSALSSYSRRIILVEFLCLKIHTKHFSILANETFQLANECATFS